MDIVFHSIFYQKNSMKTWKTAPYISPPENVLPNQRGNKIKPFLGVQKREEIKEKPWQNEQSQSLPPVGTSTRCSRHHALAETKTAANPHPARAVNPSAPTLYT